ADAVEHALNVAVSQMRTVQRFGLGAGVGVERGAVANVGAIGGLEVAELGDQIEFDLLFCGRHEPCLKDPNGLLPPLFWRGNAMELMYADSPAHRHLHLRRLHAPIHPLRRAGTSTAAPRGVRADPCARASGTRCPWPRPSAGRRARR